jgi:hypothetical protein
MLTTGIEVEARPPGKKIKRLSLLSGGERSLTAVALLVAIFRARPSPFYVLDEVEAALDDVNLGRLITLMGQLREELFGPGEQDRRPLHPLISHVSVPPLDPAEIKLLDPTADRDGLIAAMAALCRTPSPAVHPVAVTVADAGPPPKIRAIMKLTS